ncbi:30S ribosomal protein S16 [Candidatus Nanoperiomorbus periodonticus]|mgnify:FL=1|uniref:30S ribosomal protein S16 n=1 Tax=Candidatus Nanoperiomorbus periodonticus TaxID=2171989 RepID=UPI00101DE959|nr:30S ribosomal protein S16 [Candidatus Nanoperiomorbus periodonticus]RYC76020.1 30S ribosomal protein S16 [Candidatus Nanoperiomorbus periodonticus]RYC76547.1 30S ribosomal protein S16 [Candidatus Nanoperiomorbus periodonticus]
MLAIRLQRQGKTHYATYRVIVQDVLRHPSSGKVVAYVGSYNPHTKQVQLDKEAIENYLSHGAQPTDRVVRILTGEGMTMPKWVKTVRGKQRDIRNPEKLRRNQPKEESVETPAEETAASDSSAAEPSESAETAEQDQSAE